MGRQFSAEPHVPKYQQVFETLSGDILRGKYKAGQKFPSEAALVQQFGASRITIGRALQELARRELVERIAGSGTYVRAARPSESGMLFGLIIPDLGRTEVFEPICRGIAGAPGASRHSLLWGYAGPEGSSLAGQALAMCDRCIERHVSGVFFAPLEVGERFEETNQSVVSRLEEARIPIVLLDRCVLPYPARCRHDLVGIDNRRAAFVATDHLLKLGAERVSFVAGPGRAPTVTARIAGFHEARPQGTVYRLREIDEASLQPILDAWKPGDGVVCANDRTAGQLMRVLLALNLRIPDDVRIVGMDDVEYASLLPVPLTTIRQPCREIGEAAVGAMLERIARPKMLVRDVLVEFTLVVRQSCGV